MHRAGCLQPPGVVRGAQGTLTVSGLTAGDSGDGEHMAQRQSWPFACRFPILNLSHFSLLPSISPSLHRRLHRLPS